MLHRGYVPPADFVEAVRHQHAGRWMCLKGLHHAPEPTRYEPVVGVVEMDRPSPAASQAFGPCGVGALSHGKAEQKGGDMLHPRQQHRTLGPVVDDDDLDNIPIHPDIGIDIGEQAFEVLLPVPDRYHDA